MTTNFTQNGTDIDQVLIRQQYASKVPSYKRKPGYAWPGSLWGWGYNQQGQLGLGNTATPQAYPQQIGYVTNWQSITCAIYASLAIKSNGTLWAWGNNNGQLGLNDYTSRSSPVQVGSLSNWSSVASGANSTVATKTDGTLWSWGDNYSGQLGVNIPATNSPVQVGTLTNWAVVGSNKYYSNFGIKTDGTLWSWGSNTYGVLGLGDITHRSSPVQVGSLTNWASITGITYKGVLATKTDGTLWAWGKNDVGNLGLGDTISRSSPVQVGSLTNWKLVVCGAYHTLATKTDGTLWAWGQNYAGNLGLSTATGDYRSSPVQVGTLTNWDTVAASMYHSMAIKTDGTLWSWGQDSLTYYQYGDGGANYPGASSPVQIGSLTNWKSIAGGYYHSLGIKF